MPRINWKEWRYNLRYDYLERKYLPASNRYWAMRAEEKRKAKKIVDMLFIGDMPACDFDPEVIAWKNDDMWEK